MVKKLSFPIADVLFTSCLLIFSLTPTGTADSPPSPISTDSDAAVESGSSSKLPGIATNAHTMLITTAGKNCTDVSGDWDYYSSGKVTCSAAGETETEKTSDSGTITIDQNSCKVSWEVYEYNVKRKGSVSGNKIKVSGKFAIALASGVKFTQNTYTAQGKINGDEIALRGSGKVAGTYQGVSFSCTGNDKNTFTRSSNEEDAEYVRKPLVKRKTSRKFSTSFSDDSVKNIPKCVPIKIIGE